MTASLTNLTSARAGTIITLAQPEIFKKEGQAFPVEFVFENNGFKFTLKQHLQNHS